MLHETLWQLNADIAQECLAHPFVHGLADGTLNRDVFRRYVAQDTFFLNAFFRAYSLAAAKCENMESARVFHQLMAGVLEELKLHGGYAATLDVNLSDVEPYPATSAYTDFLLRVAWSGSLAEILAANDPVHAAVLFSRWRTSWFVACRASIRRLDQRLLRRRFPFALCSIGIIAR